MENLIPFLIILILASSISNLYSKPLAVCFPIVSCGIIILLFICGIFNQLTIGIYVIWLLAFVGFIYIIICKKYCFKKIIVPATVLLFLALIVSIIWHRYDTVSTWDELAQWALAAKNTFLNDKFACDITVSNKGYQDYPPAIELFHYFWLKSGNGYKDGSLYVSMNMLILIFIVPALEKINFNSPLKIIVSCIFILLTPYALFPWAYSRLMVDAILGILFGWLLATYYMNREKINSFFFLACSEGLFVLPLIKKSGIFFVIIFLVLIIIDQIKNKKSLEILLLMLPAMISKLLWGYELAKVESEKTFSLEDPLERINDAAVWQKEGFTNFFKALFNYKAIEETSQTVYNIGVIKVSAIVWIILLIAITFLILKLYNWRGKIFVIGIVICMFIYILSCSFLYLLSFSEGEVLILSSFSRYINTYLVAMLILNITLFINYYSESELRKEKWILAVFVFYCLSIYIPRDMNPISYYSNKLFVDKKSEYIRRSEYEEYMVRLKRYLPNDAILHNFNGDIAASNYCLTPIKVKSPIWQSGDFEWYRSYAEILGYTHVFFEGTFGSVETVEFKKQFGDLFINENEILDFSLYEVIWVNDVPMLNYITTILP